MIRGGHPEISRNSSLNWRRVRICTILIVIPGLSGCLPGLSSGDSSSDPVFTQASISPPAVNRSYKSNFLALQTSEAGDTTRSPGRMVATDSTPNLITAAFSTVERRVRESSLLGRSSLLSNSPETKPDGPLLPANQALQNFYAALDALNTGQRTEPVTILHLGDDHATDDRFAGDLRENLQSRFGNAGRGLMTPGLFPTRGLKVDRSGEWTILSAAVESRGPYGLSGVRVSAENSDAWVRLTSTQGAFDWIEVTFATGPNQGTAIVSVDGDIKIVPTAARVSDQTSIRITAKARELLIKPKGDGAITLLSVATGLNARGVRYVNLGLPGATALTLARWDTNLVRVELAKIKPDLIILDYGINEGSDDTLNKRDYQSGLQRLVTRLGELAPSSSLLIIGPPDAARLPNFSGSAGGQVCRALNAEEMAIYDRLVLRQDSRLSRWHAPPNLEFVRSIMKQVASANGAFYWDWGKYMGGSCSAHAWSTAKPALASPDHVTLTAQGMARSARALLTEVMSGYDAFQRSLRVAKTVSVAEPVKRKPAKTAVKASKKAQQN